METTIEKNQLNDLTDSKQCNFDLDKFRLEKILNNNSQSKLICVYGQFISEHSIEENRKAIIIFEKIAFTEDNVKTEINEKLNCSSFFTRSTELKEVFVNDIYGNFKCIPNAELNSNFAL